MRAQPVGVKSWPMARAPHLEHGTDLFAVGRPDGGGAAVVDQAGDVLQWHAGVGEQGDEAVPRLPVIRLGFHRLRAGP